MENFMDFTTGDIVAINVHALYYAFGLRLSNTEVNVTPKNRIKDGMPSDYWYDLDFHASGKLACMDGEECEIVNIDKHGNITFCNRNGDDEVFFILSPEESKVALYSY